MVHSLPTAHSKEERELGRFLAVRVIFVCYSLISFLACFNLEIFGEKIFIYAVVLLPIMSLRVVSSRLADLPFHLLVLF